MSTPFLLRRSALTATLAFCFASGTLAESAHATSVLVIRDKKQTLEQLAAKLPPDVKIVSSYDDLVLIEGAIPPSLKDLKKRLGARFLKRGHTVYSPIPTAPVSEAPSPVSDPARVPTPLRGLAALTDRCPDGRSRLWAQESLDAPLLEATLAKLDPKIQAQSARVAVLDSGFDATQLDAFSAIGGVQPRDGVLAGDQRPVGTDHWLVDSRKDPTTPVTGRPTIDPSGHGTMVASTIAATEGLGVAKNIELSVYRITAEGDGGSTSSNYIDIALWRACQDLSDPKGLTLINLSWGGRLEEQQSEDAENARLDQEMEKRLGDAGCLVFKAAGNDNFRNTRRDDKLDDATLRIAATDLSRNLSSFSTRGEVSAPGSDVWVVQSAQSKKSERAASKCEPTTSNTKPRRFVNGTSFAAPFTAAVASQIVRVLKAGEKFSTLAVRDRIKLVNRILKASTLSGSINLPRAVQIAAEWNKQPIPGDPDQLRALLKNNPNPLCSEPKPQRCGRLTDPILAKACVADVRLKVATCESVDAPTLEDLALASFKEAEIELGLKAADLFSQVSTDAKAKRKILKNGIDQFIARTGKTDYVIATVLTPNLLRALVLPYLEACTIDRNCDKELSFTLVRAALLSKPIASSLSEGVDTETGEDRGSRETQDAMSRLFELSFKAIPFEGGMLVLKMLHRAAFGNVPNPEEILHENTDDQKYFERTPVPRLAPSVVVRLLDAFIRVTKPGSGFAEISTRLEGRVLAEMAKKNEYFLGKTEKLVMYIETMPERGSFDAALERHRARIDAVLENGKWETLAPIEVHYLLRNPKADPKWKGSYVQSLIEVARRALDGRGWGAENDIELVMLALKEAFAPSSTLPPRDQATLSEALGSALAQAKNVDVLLELEYLRGLNLIVGQTVTDWFATPFKEKREAEKNGLTLKSHALLEPSRMANLRMRLAAGIVHSQGRHRKFNRIRFQDVLERLAIDHGTSAPIFATPDPSALPLTAFEGPAPTRLSDPKRPTAFALELTHESRAALIDTLATRLIVDGFERTSAGLKLSPDSDRESLFYQSARWTWKSENRKPFYLGFNPMGAWRKAAQSLIDSYKSYTEYQTSDAIFALRAFIERVDEEHGGRR